MPYSINTFAKHTGVTPRTLRFYEQKGLLTPSQRQHNGYRVYTDTESARLQQILFFRELDFPLDEIKHLLDHPRFDPCEALAYQKELLLMKKKRLAKLIRTIETTLTHMSTHQPVDDKDIYGSLSQEEIESYKREAKERWGHTDAYRQSQERVKGFKKEDWQAIQDATDANMKALVALMVAGKAPTDPEVQAEIAKHHAGIERFYECSTQIYRGLGEMYLADQRFGDFYRKYHTDLPEFLVQGMRAFCDGKEAPAASAS